MRRALKLKEKNFCQFKGICPETLPLHAAESRHNSWPASDDLPYLHRQYKTKIVRTDASAARLESRRAGQFHPP